MSFFCEACGETNKIAVNGGRCSWCNCLLGIPTAKLKKYPRQYACHTIVNIAVRAGILPRLDGSIDCVDCGKPAEIYEHRDYMKPLDVVPNCQKCNLNKSPAKNNG